MNTKLITLKHLLSRIPLSKSEIYRRIKLGTFPRPVRIGLHRIAFDVEEVEEWINVVRGRHTAREIISSATDSQPLSKRGSS